MSKQKQTFTDPKTGEEIASTGLARWGACLTDLLVNGPLIPLGVGLLFGLGGVMTCVVFLGSSLPDTWPIVGVFVGLGIVVVVGLVRGLFQWLVRSLPSSREVMNPVTQRVHDAIARHQHFRRQRILRRQEYPHVPDEALSRAEQPREPEPTDASLSQTEVEEEEKARLTEAVEEEARPGLWQSIKARFER